MSESGAPKPLCYGSATVRCDVSFNFVSIVYETVRPSTSLMLCTWLRKISSQQIVLVFNVLFISGVLTGSVYKDYALMKNGFPGESITNGSVIAIKTHEFGPDALSAFDRAVLLVRDPFASILAEFNRRSGGHVGHAAAEKYRRHGGKYWRAFVR
jgi:hypothetical protein